MDRYKKQPQFKVKVKVKKPPGSRQWYACATGVRFTLCATNRSKQKAVSRLRRRMKELGVVGRIPK